MKSILVQSACALAVASSLLLAPAAGTFAQSRRQPPTSPQKKNQRPGQTEPQQQQQQEPLPTDIIQETEVVKVASSLVNVEAVVYNKKSKHIVTGLKRENFAIFEDGVLQPITNFSTPEAPITVSIVLEYSKLAQAMGYYGSSGMEPGQYEVLRPMAMFLQQFIKPPDDYVSVIAYDMRPTPLTDFTNDPARISQVISLMLRNRPVSNEANLFDALKLVLVGGRADSVVLENSKERTAEYGGMASLQNRRRAVFLISTGLDTFSRINYDEARKIAQNAGVPIYIVGTGNLFFKKFGDDMSPQDGLGGSTSPGRMSLLQAQNTLRTFAEETGGMYIPVTFEGELPAALQTINTLMRNQYSLAYSPGERRDGKRRKIVVKVDVDGDGQYEEKEFVVKARQFYNAPKG
ncbi:MAG TPA: VWA domain-containing protein [Pyrinomonadaceae bacterium]|nr:VWA domain-containing protein [Pyrinomonadaceae bacterium]